nr:hypothetical protein [Tanacetum cinerariifolium]
MDMGTDNVLQRVDACDLDYKFTTKVVNNDSEDVEELQHPKASEGAIVAPTACKVVKVLVNEGMEVKKGQHLFSLDVDQVPSSSSPFVILSEEKKSEIKKILEQQSSELVEQHNAENSPMAGLDNKEDVLKRYGSFKKFDTVVDHSDHLFSAQSSSPRTSQKSGLTRYVKSGQFLLRTYLVCIVFYKANRIDLLRAVIIRPPGTPYHDGLFFFDVYFPSNYPNSPQLVCSHSGIIGVNLNVMDCDEVPLILRNTTRTLEKEWGPGTSLLQLLVFIEHKILNTNPLFNGLAMTSEIAGDWCSLLYSENIFIKSLKIMVHTMNRPLKHFESFVARHFISRAHDILLAYKSYKKGQQVGFLACKDNKVCSMEFRKDINSCVQPLVKAFKKIGSQAAVGKNKARPSCSAPLFPSSEHEKVVIKKYLEEIPGVSFSSIEIVLVKQANTENSTMIVPCNEEDTLKRYENFKKFDTVVDHSDHLFSAHTSPVAVQKASRPKEWVDRISEEWKVLGFKN